MFGFFGNKSNWQYNDLPTPKSKEEFLKLADTVFTDRMKWLTEDAGWRTFYQEKDEDGLTIEEFSVNGSNITAIRSTMLAKTDEPEKLAKFIHSADFEERSTVYEDLISHRKVEDIDTDIHIGHTQFKTPPIIGNREFLTLRTYKALEDGRHFVGVQSINREDTPFSNGFVRGVSNCTALVTPTDEENTYIVRTVDHIEPKGWVPSALVNIYKKKAGMKLKNLVTKLCPKD